MAHIWSIRFDLERFGTVRTSQPIHRVEGGKIRNWTNACFLFYPAAFGAGSQLKIAATQSYEQAGAGSCEGLSSPPDS